MTVCLLASCSQRHTAIALAEDFIEQNAMAPEAMEQRDFSQLGTTSRLNDSIIASLRERASEFYRQGISYPAYQQGDTLFYIRMRFVHQGDTLSHTFYIDNQLEHVVAVK